MVPIPFKRQAQPQKRLNANYPYDGNVWCRQRPDCGCPHATRRDFKHPGILLPLPTHSALPGKLAVVNARYFCVQDR